MKILFLHLSDAHLRNNTDLRLININGIINSLGQIENFEECVMVFSGDVVHSGDENAYKKAGKLVGYIAKGISRKYIEGKIVQTLIVPGNHDNLVKNKERDNLELESYYKDKTLDLKYNEDLEQLSNFYKFSSRNRCFSQNRIIDVRKLKFGNFVIKANLINSAPFYLLGEGNRDKGMHYIPLYELEKLNIDINQKYTISIIHHGPEWFSDTTKNNIEYLSKPSVSSTLKLPDKKDKEKIKKAKNEMEKEIIEEKEQQSDSLYSYDASKVNSFSNKIAKSINYLGLVAKILPNFRFMLQGEEKKVITNILYKSKKMR